MACAHLDNLLCLLSKCIHSDEIEGMTYAPDSDIIQEGETSSTSSISNTPDIDSAQHGHALMSPVVISTTKVRVHFWKDVALKNIITSGIILVNFFSV